MSLYDWADEDPEYSGGKRKPFSRRLRDRRAPTFDPIFDDDNEDRGPRVKLRQNSRMR